MYRFTSAPCSVQVHRTSASTLSVRPSIQHKLVSVSFVWNVSHIHFPYISVALRLLLSQSRVEGSGMEHFALKLICCTRCAVRFQTSFLVTGCLHTSWGCYSVADEDYGVLGYKAMLISNLLPTVWTTLKMEAANLRNFCGKLPINAASYSRETVIVTRHITFCA